MDKQTELLLEKMNKKMDELKKEFMMQTTTLTETFTRCMTVTIDEKLKPLVEENLKLNNEVITLKTTVHNLEKEVRKNNIILHGIEETEESNADLLELVLTTFNNMGKTTGMQEFDKWEICGTYRLGKRVDKKRRPILVKLTLAWRRMEILKNNKNFPTNTYATEDFPKEVLAIRKELKLKQQEERKKGNLAIIRYDKLILKGKLTQEEGQEKRKRSPSKTPTKPNSEGGKNMAPNKMNKTNAFQSMTRPRSHSQSGTSKN